MTDERLRELWHEVSGMPLMHSTRDFARAVEAEARREALEAAAKVCDLRINGTGPHCAEAIRALAKGVR